MPTIYPVSRITAHIRDALHYDDLLADVWVEGEIANLRRPGSGHAYFSLRDSKSSLRCVAFRNSRGMSHLQDGAKVIAHGRVSIYEARGDLQLVADLIQPEGAGELQLRLERLIARLEREGLFDASRKRPLPAFPKRIGVVTSPTGAVWRDIQTVVSRRYPLVELLLAPAMVQGDAAAATIVEALAALNDADGVDAVIVARGGGSLEDLWPFNEESVARAAFASRAPVVSAVGHETDTTVCDLVADLRAPTPSAAAEMVIPDRAELALRIVGAARTIEARAMERVERGYAAANALRERVDRAAPDFDARRVRVDDLLDDARTTLLHRIGMSKSRVDALSIGLAALSPRDTLRRGYAIVSDRSTGAPISNAAQVSPGDWLDIAVNIGIIPAVAESPSDGSAQTQAPSGD